MLSHVQLFETPWTVALQATVSIMGFPRQEYWSELPFFYPGDLPDPGIKPMSLALAGRFFMTESPGKRPKERGQDKTAYEKNFGEFAVARV